ncbi:MAG TPA: MobF family relaxase [Solirubrobacteraceae bacterium]|nr:MobF family relaxase [Solirubrobacteraceae bacterium]
MTAASIGATKAGGYARYLEGKTMTPDRGDYYLHPSGEPGQTPGRWLSTQRTLAMLGIEDDIVGEQDFVSLLEGRHPRTGGWIRAAGADGRRGGGIDLTFSAPKSVSAVWALGDTDTRRQLEAAHADAVRRTVSYLRETVPAVRRRREGKVVEEPAADLLAAEYRHNTARGVLGGDPPDPQLHSHVVITSAVREDGRLVAVASRPLFRAARELGAYYRSALADELAHRGYTIRAGTGRDGRYFELAGVPDRLLQAFSARGREVAQAAERFRARWGRPPERGELRSLKLENRKAKRPVTQVDLQRHWQQAATTHGYSTPTRQRRAGQRSVRPIELESRVEGRLTERAATFDHGELRAVALEQSVGQLPPEQALVHARRMIDDGRVLALTGGVLTTRAIRARERAIERRLRRLAATPAAAPDRGQLHDAAGRVAERLGARLSDEQLHALRVIAGPTRTSVLVGPAGTGKGVVIDAAARAEQSAQRQTFGVAVSGSTAQRLARDSPALAGRTLTLDALVARTANGRLSVDDRTTIYLDEAGMADTDRLHGLTTLADRAGVKLVLIGDPAQLPSISAGGMFERLIRTLRTAELSEVRRAHQPAERRAWADLRAGRSDRALAYYRARGRLHLNDTRVQTIEQAVRDWARLTQTLPVGGVALISDASNQEIDRLNARAQHHRLVRGDLGDVEIPIPGVHYGLRAGDRVALIDQHRPTGLERVENGERGEVIDISEEGELLVQFDATGRWRTFAGEELARLRLAYAQHAYRVQGATVTRALVVTGGWQTGKEACYVQASRARDGTDFYLAREELGSEGHDVDRVERLAARMRTSRAQRPSLAHRRTDRDHSVLERTIGRVRRRARSLERLR